MRFHSFQLHNGGNFLVAPIFAIQLQIQQIMIKYAFFALLPIIALLPACDRHESEHHHTEVTFVSPTDGQEIPEGQASDIELRIDFSTEGEHLEGIDIRLFTTASPTEAIFTHEIHEHEQAHSFVQNLDLSAYTSGTAFTLDVSVCHDHECTDKELESITFRLE
jgi:hypothetical protein